MVMELSKICQAKLHLMMVIHELSTPPGEQAASTVMLPNVTSALLDLACEEAELYLVERMGKLIDKDIPVTGEVQRIDPARQIVHSAMEIKTDIIALGTHSKTAMDAFWSGSATPELATQTHLPLLLVPVRESYSIFFSVWNLILLHSTTHFPMLTTLQQHFDWYPFMEPRDVDKLIYQGIKGSEHLITSSQGFIDYLSEGFEPLQPDPTGRLLESIRPDQPLFRINLRPYKALHQPVDLLVPALLETARVFSGILGAFRAAWMNFVLAWEKGQDLRCNVGEIN